MAFPSSMERGRGFICFSKNVSSGGGGAGPGQAKIGKGGEMGVLDRAGGDCLL